MSEISFLQSSAPGNPDAQTLRSIASSVYVLEKKIWVVGDRIITSGDACGGLCQRLGTVSSVDKKIGITWDNGHFGEYTPKQMQAWNYQSYTCDKCRPMQRTPQIQNVHCPSCESPLLTLNDGCGVCGWTPENSSEETQPQPEVVQKPKGRQRKRCLYRYIENKKLKNGSIASYPRVIGHRYPDNPTHWRWGFNWEEKVDGEWKGRSFGCVPVGAIALIQSMQERGVSLEEIIGFIRRAKAKK